MPFKKGLATSKRVERYIYLDADSEEISPPPSSGKSYRSTKTNIPRKSTSTLVKQSRRQSWSLAGSDEENINPANPRGFPKLSSLPYRGQPSQASKSLRSGQLQQSIHPKSLSPRVAQDRVSSPRELVNSKTTKQPPNTPAKAESNPQDLLRNEPDCLNGLNARPEPQAKYHDRPNQLQARAERSNSDFISLSSDPPIYQPSITMANMIPGGAFVPPNQQRNLRACMVCSIVRTQAQFISGGCPNCEDILEFIGNSDNVLECTSAVFEGLITVADTSKSWVARYQRLEGYVPGVYATQVEGILPEEMVSAIESAGINYVPRDGSEDQMIPKD